jgi:hypothetical protein
VTELRPTTDWPPLEAAVEAIARKASVGITPKAHADSLWVRLGMREITPLAIYEGGRRVGSLFYEVHHSGDAPIFHIAGLHMDGSAEKGWFKRVLEVAKPIAEGLGCGNRLHFSSPRSGWARRAGSGAGFKAVSTSWLYEEGGA